MALAEQEPVARRRRHRLRANVQHLVVQHPDHVERRLGRGTVLLVAGLERTGAGPDRRTPRPVMVASVIDMLTMLQVKVMLRSRRRTIRCWRREMWVLHKHGKELLAIRLLCGEVRTMGAGDKIENAAEKVAGKAKEATGKATDDEQLEAEGKADQSKSDLKQAAEKVKDAFKNYHRVTTCTIGRRNHVADAGPAHHR